MSNDSPILVTRSSMPPFEEYIDKIKSLWDTHWLTNMGTFHMELEKQLMDFLDVPYVSLMVNGHMALELTLQAFGFPEGSEVITTPFTFISTTHAIIRNRLIPVFCDVHKETGVIDETKIESLITEKTVAILPVHVYGNSCNVYKIKEIADKYHLKVIYDAAHAFGVEYQGKGIASYGDAAVFSFHATKVFNTIEGGAVACADREVYDKLYNLKNFGIHGEEIVSDIGANAKMNEFCAAMGICNLEHIEQALSSRKKIWDYYVNEIESIKGISVLYQGIGQKHNYAYFPIVVEPEYGINRNQLYEIFKDHGIYTRKYFFPLTCDQRCFGDKYRNASLPIARKLSDQILCLPIYEGLEIEQTKKIIRLMKGRQK